MVAMASPIAPSRRLMGHDHQRHDAIVFFAGLVLDDRGDRDVVPAEDTGNLRQHAGPILHVEPQVVASGRPWPGSRSAYGGCRRSDHSSKRAEGDRRSADGSCRSRRPPRPRRWAFGRLPGRGRRRVRPRRPRRGSRCMPRAPRPAACPAESSVGETCSSSPSSANSCDGQQLDAVAQLLGVAHVGQIHACRFRCAESASSRRALRTPGGRGSPVSERRRCRRRPSSGWPRRSPAAGPRPGRRRSPCPGSSIWVRM